MAPLLSLLQLAVGIASLVCFVMVLIQIFQHGQTVLGVVCIVTLCIGVGALITFVYGWVKSSEWNIQKIMLIWTVCWVVAIVTTPFTFTVPELPAAP